MSSGSLQAAVRAVAERDARPRWSICLRGPQGAVRASHDPAETLSTASVGKLLLLIEVARRCAASPEYGDETLGRNGIEPVADSGLLQHLSVERLSVKDLAVLVASVSDNLATNILLEAVGLAEVDEAGRRLGLRATKLLDRVRDDRRPEHAPTLSRGDSQELSRLMAEVAGGTLIGVDVSAQLRDWLSLGVDLSLVASAFGLDPLAHPAGRAVSLLNKTGTDRGIRADVGTVSGPGGRLAYAVIANWEADDPEGDDGDVLDVVLDGMRQLGLAIRREIVE